MRLARTGHGRPGSEWGSFTPQARTGHSRTLGSPPPLVRSVARPSLLWLHGLRVGAPGGLWLHVLRVRCTESCGGPLLLHACRCTGVGPVVARLLRCTGRPVAARLGAQFGGATFGAPGAVAAHSFCVLMDVVASCPLDFFTVRVYNTCGAPARMLLHASAVHRAVALGSTGCRWLPRGRRGGARLVVATLLGGLGSATRYPPFAA